MRAGFGIKSEKFCCLSCAAGYGCKGVEVEVHDAFFVDLDVIEYTGSHHSDQEVSTERTRSDHFRRAIIHVFDGECVRMLWVGWGDADDPVWFVEHQLDRIRTAEFTPRLFVQPDHAFGSDRHPRFLA